MRWSMNYWKERRRRRRAQRVAAWSSQELGVRGERLAERFLRREGLVIVARGARDELGEIDLVAVEHRRTIVFIEVKTRRSLRHGPPGSAVTARKQRKIIRAAERFISRRHLEQYAVRYDVVSIYWPLDGSRPVVDHFPSAFTCDVMLQRGRGESV